MSDNIPGHVSPNPNVINQQPQSIHDSIREENGLESATGHLRAKALESFNKLDKLMVIQHKELGEDCCCWCCGYEGENGFDVMDTFGKVILRAHEDSNCCLRQCCDQLRPFEMQLRDKDGLVLISIKRSLRCNNVICCPCLNQSLVVECPPGKPIGSVRQNSHLFAPSFDVCNADGETAYIIQGPSSCNIHCKACCTSCLCMRRWCQRCCGCCQFDVTFEIKSESTGRVAGHIAKKWDGPETPMSTDKDRFAMDFPDDATFEEKATILAGCFLIDFLYFEGNNGGKGEAME